MDMPLSLCTLKIVSAGTMYTVLLTFVSLMSRALSPLVRSEPLNNIVFITEKKPEFQWLTPCWGIEANTTYVLNALKFKFIIGLENNILV